MSIDYKKIKTDILTITPDELSPNTKKNETRSMRSKEDAHDYRYFPDPDLLPLELDENFINDIKKNIPELPDEKRKDL